MTPAPAARSSLQHRGRIVTRLPGSTGRQDGVRSPGQRRTPISITALDGCAASSAGVITVSGRATRDTAFCGTIRTRSQQRTGDTVSYIVAVGIVAFLFFLYWASLKLNPWVKCSNCKNKPKIRGWVANYAHHVCPKCKGTGQQLRLGRKLFFKEPVPPWKR